MEREEFVERLNFVLNKLSITLSAKSADYSEDADVFKNFRLCEAFGITSVERGMFTRLLDKVGRTANLLSKERGEENYEAIDDSILDLAGYAVLLYLWMTRLDTLHKTPTIERMPCR